MQLVRMTVSFIARGDTLATFAALALGYATSSKLFCVQVWVYLNLSCNLGDGTSSYLWTFDSWRKVKGNEEQTEPKVTAADIIYKLTPLAKFVFVLRNPTER